VVAGLIFALLPSTARYAQEVRPYAFAVMGAVLASLLLFHALDRPTRGRWVAYAAALVFIAFAHIVALSILAAHALAAWQASRAGGGRVVLKRWAVAVAGALGCVLPIVLVGSQQSGAIGWIKLNAWAVETLPEYLAGSAQVAEAVVILALVGSALLARTSRSVVGVLLTWALVPPVFCALTATKLHLFLARYLLFTVPAWCLLAGAGLAAVSGAVSSRAEFRWTQVAFALPMVAALAWLSLPGQAEAREPTLKGQPDFRAVGATLARHARAGDAIAYAGMRFGRVPLAYELRRRPRPHDLFERTSAARRGSFWAEECGEASACLGNTRRIWLVTTAPRATPFAAIPPARAELLRQLFTITETHRGRQVDILLLVRKT
jgi:mannosyltransferase